MRTIQGLGAIAALVAGVLYFNFGTLSPCGVLRETVRHRDGLAAVLPDSVVDLAISAQYGALSPGRCVEILLNNETAQATPQPQPAARPQAAQTQRTTPTPVTPPAQAAQDAIRVAFNETNQAANECKAKRLTGELPTHVASVKCSNPRMIRAFDVAHYKYMDLIEFFAAKRLELAAKIDRRELTEDQADAEGNKVYAGIVEAERRRDSGIRQ